MTSREAISATAMPVRKLYIGWGNPLNIGWLSHDTLCQQGPGRVKVTGCGKNAEIWTFLGPVLRPVNSGMQRGGIGLSYTVFGRHWESRIEDGG